MGVFVFLAIVGVIIFSAYKGSSKDAVNVTVWGTISKTSFEEIIKQTSLYQSKEFSVNYVEKSEEKFDEDFVEALASGVGPDLFMLPSDKILKHRNKIFPIPYNVLTQRQFKDAFVEGAEIYMFPEGVLALPIFADPLVMYWNRNIFNNAKVTIPPKYWDEFYNLANLMSKKDGSLNILKSAVAMGEFSNIAHAKDIIANLAIQAGTPITSLVGGQVISVLEEMFSRPTMPSEAAINRYTEFSNPAKPSYSWNRSLPKSTNYFLSGDLAIYFGLASEIGMLRLKNPNLNFDVAEIPIEREKGADISFTNFNSLAVAKASKNISAAYSVASILSSNIGAKAISEELKLPPVRRDLLAQKSTDAFMSIFYSSAIRAKSWLDPLPEETNDIFKDMIESITSGRARTLEAISKANDEITSLLKKQ